MESIIWLALLAVFLIIEILTVGLTSIWFAGGALAGLILNLLDAPLIWQVVAFLLVSILLLVFTRPFAIKHINSHHEKTNYEGIIGKVIRITETVDNMKQTGKAEVNGLDWTVRCEDEEDILIPGTVVKVMDIAGVKLIVKRYEEM